MDREKVIKGLEICSDCGFCESIKKFDLRCPYRNNDGKGCDRSQLLMDALTLLKEQEEQKRKWLQTIADTQLAISPTGYESEDELAKRGWEWNGLQMAWEIIAGEERSEHPRLVRCKDCKQSGIDSTSYPQCWCSAHAEYHDGDWFCADGERKDS